MTWICMRCFQELTGCYALLDHGMEQLFNGETPHYPFRKMEIGSWKDLEN